MKYLHTMIRVQNLELALEPFVKKIGLQEIRRKDVPTGSFTLVFLATDKGELSMKLTYNWDQDESYLTGCNFSHVAYSVKNFYQYFKNYRKKFCVFLLPFRDGKMAFIRSLNKISIELFQEGYPPTSLEPWISMPNEGEW